MDINTIADTMKKSLFLDWLKNNFNADKEEKIKKNYDYWSTDGGKYYKDKTIQEKLSSTVSSNLNIALKSKKMGQHWEDIVGYTLEELMAHLESKFAPGMTWDNYGSYWHVDHIIPKSWWIYESYRDREFRQCWCLANLQPLEARLNRIKHNNWAG